MNAADKLLITTKEAMELLSCSYKLFERFKEDPNFPKPIKLNTENLNSKHFYKVAELKAFIANYKG